MLHTKIQMVNLEGALDTGELWETNYARVNTLKIDGKTFTIIAGWEAIDYNRNLYTRPVSVIAEETAKTVGRWEIYKNFGSDSWVCQDGVVITEGGTPQSCVARMAHRRGLLW